MARKTLQPQGKVVIHFPKEKVDEPIICYLTSDYGVMFNILKATITPEQEGLMVLELLGDADACQKGLEYLLLLSFFALFVCLVRYLRSPAKSDSARTDKG